MTIFSRPSKEIIDTKKIVKIPKLVKDNLSILQYCSSNFQRISYITEISGGEVKNQFFVGLNDSIFENETAFNGLQLTSKLQLSDHSGGVIPYKEKDEYEGLISFKEIPPKYKVMTMSDDLNYPQQKPAYDQCVDVIINAIDNEQAWIVTTTQNKNKIIDIDSLPNFNWQWIILPLIILLWMSELGVLFFLLKWKYDNVMGDFYQESQLLDNFSRLLEFWNNSTVILGLLLFCILFIGGIITIGYLWKKRGRLTYKEYTKKDPKHIAEEKEETAIDNHEGEKYQWGAVKQSFSVLIRGNKKDKLLVILDSLKRSIEAIYRGAVFEINGFVIQPEAKGFMSKIKSFFGWDVESFLGTVRDVRPFKPTIMSIPRSGKNYFALMRERFIPGTDFLEGNAYKIPTERTKYGLHLGEIFRKISERSYPYYIKPQDLLTHVFIYGPTESGKSFFVYSLLSHINKFYPDINFIVLDPKGEYARLFVKKEDVIVFIIDSQVAPLGINIFKLLDDVKENKRLVSKLLSNYFIYMKRNHGEISPFMEDVINQAIDRVYLEDREDQHMRTFIQKIHVVLDETERAGGNWADKTRLALNARFRELFTGRFEQIFCAKESNLTKELLVEKNVIIQMNKLLTKQENDTMKFLVNVITTMVGIYLEGLYDFELIFLVISMLLMNYKNLLLRISSESQVRLEIFLR